MTVWIFEGPIIPMTVELDVDMGAQVKWIRNGDLLDATVDVRLRRAKATVRLETGNTVLADDPIELRWLAKNVTQNVLDVLGYQNAEVFTVEIETAKNEDTGYQRSFTSGMNEPHGPVVELETLGDLQGRSPELRHALRNYRLAVLYNDDTALYCFRALESIRQAFVAVEDGNDTKPSWKKMSANLGLSKTWAEPLAGMATEQRHGDNETFTTAVMRRRWVEQARVAIDRFIAYLAGGSTPLDATTYPLR